MAVQEPALPDDDTLLFEQQVFLCLAIWIKPSINSYSRAAPPAPSEYGTQKIPSPHTKDINLLRKKSIFIHAELCQLCKGLRLISWSKYSFCLWYFGCKARKVEICMQAALPLWRCPGPGSESPRCPAHSLGLNDPWCCDCLSSYFNLGEKRNKQF